MLVRYCDRCGAVIEEFNKYDSCYIEARKVDDKLIFKKDLCCNCKRKLIEFLGGEDDGI